MDIENRQAEILELIQQEKCTSVKELCSMIYASDATIRRDLHALEQKGLIQLLYGNIIPLTEKPQVLPLAFREHQAKSSKRALACYAASLIQPNTSVLLDSSSSAMYIADFLNPEHGITVFTNCIKTAIRLYEKDIRVFLLGGLIDTKSLMTSSAWTLDTIRMVNADYLFFSAQSLSAEGYIAGVSDTGVQIRQYMIRQAEKQYFLCNEEKIGKTSTFMLCKASDITGVITNTDLSHIPDVNFVNIHQAEQ
jgi:DeoR/GlpR family transcriptional regulator of sugar metabolism